jgi:uncharacterized protein YigE (DUF2233 family)
MTKPESAALVALCILLAGAAPAEERPCRETEFEGTAYTLCEAAAGDDLRLFLHAADGRPLGGFGRIEAMLEPLGLTLVWAMNAGMYHDDRSPVGLYIEEGRELRGAVTSAGPGNFGMLPNGVFCVSPAGTAPAFAVIETRAYAAQPPACRFATQSGPMLVIEGALHPRFIPGSDSRHIRNGVGVSPDGSSAVFAISHARVSFDEFARLFRDALGMPQALYLDGKVSRLHAPDLGRSDLGVQMGPVVGLVVPR